jgi:erythronate-4-phosphate dehydrogenase
MMIVADTKTAVAQEAFARLGEVRYLATSEISHSTIKDADVVLIRSETRVDRDLLEGTAVRFVGTATIGTDHVDLEYLRSRGIGFASAPGSNANSVAEYMVAALLEFARRKTIGLEGKTLGIVGVGNVGSKVLRNARALGMQVLLNDPPLADASRDRQFLPLDALMDCDLITLHVPLTKEGPYPTHHLFDGRRLGRMKPGAVLINTSRGAVVNTEPLKSSLRSGRLGGAILDVWEREPDIDADLLSLVDIGTAHVAGFSLDGKLNAARMLFDAVCRHFGLEAAWKEIQDLPRTAVEQIPVPAVSAREETLRQLVLHCYDILVDDRQLRNIISIPAEKRSNHFHELRSGYPVRREFFNYTVKFSRPLTGLEPMLRTLGFQTT